jgi:protein subunit release factor B
LREEEATAAMCYTRKDRDDLEKEARRITESRLMEEEARHRHEEHQRRRAKEKKPLTEKVKEVVGVR